MDAKFYSVFSRALLATASARLSQSPPLQDGTAYWGVGFMDGMRFCYDNPKLAFEADRLLFSPDQDEATHLANDMLARELAKELHPTPVLEGEELVLALDRVAMKVHAEETIHTVPLRLTGADFATGRATWDALNWPKHLPLSDEQLETLENDD